MAFANPFALSLRLGHLQRTGFKKAEQADHGEHYSGWQPKIPANGAIWSGHCAARVAAFSLRPGSLSGRCVSCGSKQTKSAPEMNIGVSVTW